MQKIMFNETYGLQSATYEGRKTNTRRKATSEIVANPCTRMSTEGADEGRLQLLDGETVVATSKFKLWEVVAIAQRYSEFMEPTQEVEEGGVMVPAEVSKGWKNKLFVKAEYMPTHIKIVDIRAERLCDITDEDCIKEGVIDRSEARCEPCFSVKGINYQGLDMMKRFETPKAAFAELIDKIGGTGTWEENSWQFVYDYEYVERAKG